jgi:trk system potassium uptake protein TrkA
MRAVVIGCGRVGSALAYLLEMNGTQVTIVDRDAKALQRLGEGFHGEMLIGVGLDQDLLERAGVSKADALAAVTGSDETNAVLARLATRRFRVPRVVARMYDPRQADLYRRLGVMTISPVEWSVTKFGHLLSLQDLAPISAIGAGQVQVVEASVTPGLAGRAAGELEVPGETRLIALTRAGRTFLGASNVILEPGDVASIAVTSGSETRLQQLLGLG